jgi:lon-related putative ATP-dependent protease
LNVAIVDVEKLRRTYDPGELGCRTSEELPRLDTIVGQRRAVRALQFGLAIKEPGFNVYVAGLPGTGRTTAVKRFLEEVARDKPVPGDLCYVNDFRDSYRPQALTLPAGQARGFQADMKALVEQALREIRRAFDSDEYALRREETTGSFARKRNELFVQLDEKARQEGFALQTSPVGLVTVPLKEGQPLEEEGFQALSTEEREAISQKREELQSEVKAAFRQVRGLEKRVNEELSRLDHEVALYTLGPLIEDIKLKYAPSPEVVAYLDAVQGDILENLSDLRGEQEEQPSSPLPMPGGADRSLRRYEVNVAVDNAGSQGAPVVIESNPTYSNLFGWIEKEPQFGTLITDFTMIRGGSLHRANGGYLVIPAPELLRDGVSWESLKRSLRTGQATVEEPAERLGFMATKTLRPEPTPLDIKVVLIGDPRLYQALYAYDEDFGELFKVKADFDTRMDRTDQNVQDYASFVCTLCCEEDLKHLDQAALARLIEYSSRLAEDQDKLSTQFGAISDVVREASFYAHEEGAEYATAAHVKKAIDERFHRSNLIQERIEEMIEQGTIMIDVDGTRVGQVNGLSVSGLGDLIFGRPSRITASTGLGQGGLVDIEREANLGGPLHTKGVMILSGYLVEKYAQDKPLSLAARLVFEQSYSGVDGDSASSTELYALLSSLSGAPIRQAIAVTGSVNQKGQVQPIGGVNEKIEGFFQVCAARGLTGEQGVMIPASNVRNLMLKEEVVDAIRDGQFHIWCVETIDEGIEILTGIKAGRRGEEGTFEEGTINDLVDRRLRQFADTMARFGRHGTEEVPA